MSARPLLAGAVLLLSAASLGAQAPDDPPALRAGPPPPPISPAARDALDKVEEWIARGATTARGHEGEIVFTHGETLPTLVCAPLYPCLLSLEPGEVVLKVDLGDSVRWRVTPGVYGAGDTLTSTFTIAPTDSGLHTAAFISTDRRLYTLLLMSSETDWMPRVSFAYPESVSAAWSRYYAAQSRLREEEVLPTGLAVDELDFGYVIEGDAPWAPVRVYNDGRRTYIQFAEPTSAMADAPVLALPSARAEDGVELVNYRIVDDLYIVDRVLERAVLSAAGDPDGVVIGRRP